MKFARIIFFSLVALLFASVNVVYALGESGTTVMYKVTQHTTAGDLTTYTVYTIAAQQDGGYWLQRTVRIQPDGKPLSITQTLLDNATHEPLRYIMHRPAKMGQPENVIDLPLSKMGQHEILPTPVASHASGPVVIETPAGSFDTLQQEAGEAALWLNQSVPVLGVVRAKTQEWTMELFRIENQSVDLLPEKPEKGGIVYLE